MTIMTKTLYVPNHVKKEIEKIKNLLVKLGIRTSLKKKIDANTLIKFMESDKKKDKGIINFITIEKIGRAKIQKVKDKKLISKVINKTFSYS